MATMSGRGVPGAETAAGRREVPPGRRRGRWLIAAAGLALMMPAGRPATSIANLGSAERRHVYATVANYFAALANNVRWPEGALPRETAVKVGVLGADPFGGALKTLLAGKSVGGRPFEVVIDGAAAGLAGCQIVFVDQPRAADLTALNAATAGRPVLIIAFSPEQWVPGAMIDLVLMKNGTLRYALDSKRLTAAGLIPAPEMLPLAVPHPKP